MLNIVFSKHINIYSFIAFFHCFIPWSLVVLDTFSLSDFNYAYQGKIPNIVVLRERPFNLKRGGLCFFSKKNILIPNVAEKNILILVEEKKKI